MQYIMIHKDIIPYRFQMTLNGRKFEFEVNHNEDHDFFTLDLLRDEVLVRAGEKIVYNRPLFADEPDMPLILPFDIPGEWGRVTGQNLGEQVFLYLPQLEV